MNRFVRLGAGTIGTLASGAASLAIVLGGSGCAGRSAVQDSAPYAGPPIEIDSAGPTHHVVMHAPTSGWAFTLDRVDEVRGGREAFVTIRRPNPAMIYSQAIVEQRIGTGVPATTTLRVLARVQEFTDAPASGAYRQAAPARGQ